jgi:hypothetical protein
MEQETKDTIPLWLAVAITVVVSLPFSIWLGTWGLPIWASFIVWAEYFALGAKPKALLTIVPAYITGVIAAEVILTVYLYATEFFGTAKLYTANDIALAVVFFVGFCIAVYAMKYWSVLQTGSLPFFNGISMGLAVFFTSAFLAPFTNLDPHLTPAAAGVGAILAGLLGAALGWFNITIMFPRPVHREEEEKGHALAS